MCCQSFLLTVLKESLIYVLCNKINTPSQTFRVGDKYGTVTATTIKGLTFGVEASRKIIFMPSFSCETRNF